MEAKTELTGEAETAQQEQKVIEFGDASQETRGSYTGYKWEYSGWFLY
jgi:hypothetical protein